MGAADITAAARELQAEVDRLGAGRPAPQDITAADIERRFTYHRPEGQKVDEHEDVRLMFKDFANLLAGLPPGREKSLAFTALEEASFWAHAAVAREGK